MTLSVNNNNLKIISSSIVNEFKNQMDGLVRNLTLPKNGLPSRKSLVQIFRTGVEESLSNKNSPQVGIRNGVMYLF